MKIILESKKNNIFEIEPVKLFATPDEDGAGRPIWVDVECEFILKTEKGNEINQDEVFRINKELYYYLEEKMLNYYS